MASGIEQEDIMAITRYRMRAPIFTSPWREVDDLLTNRLGRMVEEGWTGFASTPSGDWIPAMDVNETKDELILTAELPGLNQENVEIELENNILTISGHKEEEIREETERSHLYERRYGSFQRSFTLPRTVKGDSIEATFKNGVLTVHMPKVPEAKGRKILVKAEG
jgi:HSP20 family protein